MHPLLYRILCDAILVMHVCGPHNACHARTAEMAPYSLRYRREAGLTLKSPHISATFKMFLS